MRIRPSYLAATLAALALGCGEGAPAPGDEIVLPVFVRGASDHFVSQMTGEEERPTPVVTEAHGQAVFRLSRDGRTMHYRVIVENIDDVTQSHIHILVPPATTGPFVVFLFPFNAAGVDPGNGILSEGTFTQANLIPRANIGFTGTMAELLAAMRGGTAYVNVHSVPFPAGEIRGDARETGPSQ
jgi:hypothetical protein